MRFAWEADLLEPALRWWEHLHHPDRLPALVAVWVILLTLVAILILLLTIFVLNVESGIRTRREERWRGQWLLQLLDPEGEGKDLRIDSRQLFPFLEVWTHLQDSLKGGFKDSLASLALNAGVAGLCMKALHHVRVRDRIWAATTLGHLGYGPGWDELVRLARGKDRFVSLASVRALSRIDPARAAREFLEDFIVRTDWPLNSVYAILLEMEAEVVTEPLMERLLGRNEAPPLRALQFLGAMRNEAAMVVVQTLLLRPQSWECEVTLLKSVEDPELGDFVRSRIRSESWQVIVAAVNALARIGGREDRELLLPLLGHKEWWVRYRAAHTLVRLPGIKPIEIELQATRLEDPFAREMLRHALAARNMG